jgi:Flp pilus assembly protein TadD
MEWSMRSAERALIPSRAPVLGVLVDAVVRAPAGARPLLHARRTLATMITLTALTTLTGCETVGNAFGPPEKPVSMRAPVTTAQPAAPTRVPAEASPAATAQARPGTPAPTAAVATKTEAAQPSTLPQATAAVPSAAVAPVDPAVQRAFDAAREALAAGRITDAERGFTALTRSHPDLAGPYANLAVIQRRNGKTAEAIVGLEKAVQMSPKSAELYNQLGISYRQAGEMNKAQAAYDRAIALDPRHANAQLNLGILQDLYLNDPARALAQYEAYLALVPTDEQVKKWIGELKIRLSKRDGSKKE